MARKHIMINDDESAVKLESIMESRFLSKLLDALKTLINEEYERLKEKERFLQMKASAAASLDLQNSGGEGTEFQKELLGKLREFASDGESADQFPQDDPERDEVADADEDEFIPVKKATTDTNNPFA